MKKYVKIILCLLAFFIISIIVNTFKEGRDWIDYNIYYIYTAQLVIRVLYGVLFGLIFSYFTELKASKKENIVILLILVIFSLGKILYFPLGSLIGDAISVRSVFFISETAPYFQFSLGLWIMLNTRTRHKA